MSKNELVIIILSGILISVASIIYFFLPDLLSAINPPNSKFIGLVIKAEGDSRMRFGDSINWRKLRSKDRIYSQTYLFTGADSSASYGFLDESSISLGANSLIYMDFTFKKNGRGNAGDAVALELVEGEMQINLKEKSPVKKIKIQDAMIDISKQQKTIIKLNYEQTEGLDIAVIQGDIDIKQKNVSYNVKQGEKVGIASEDSTPVAKTIDEKTMEEIKRIAESDHKKTVEDLKNKRQFNYVFQQFIEIVKEKLSP